MLENPVRESKAKKEREEKRAKLAAEKAKKKAGIMGRREANEKGVWKLEKERTRCANDVLSSAILGVNEGFWLSGLICSFQYTVYGLDICLSYWLFLLPGHVRWIKRCLPPPACMRNS